MPWTLDPRFRTAGNRAILAYIERVQPSAHSDIASVLTDSAAGLPDVRWYCPDVNAYACVVLHTEDFTIFGIAVGMSTLAFRLPAAALAQARTEGGELETAVGNGGVSFPPWRAPVNVRRWCKLAHDHAVRARSGGP